MKKNVLMISISSIIKSILLLIAEIKMKMCMVKSHRMPLFPLIQCGVSLRLLYGLAVIVCQVSKLLFSHSGGSG